MNDTKNNIVYFPHTFRGRVSPNVIADVEFKKNSINGGFRNIEDFGMNTNFFGGNCVKLGFILEYGFFACPDRVTGEIIGFHAQSPADLTDKGKKLLEALYPDQRIVYEAYDPKPMTDKEDPEERKLLVDKFIKAGGNPVMIRTISAKSILSLITVLESGMSAQPLAAPEQVAFAPMTKDNEVEVKLTGTGKPKREMVDEFVAAASKERRTRARN